MDDVTPESCPHDQGFRKERMLGYDTGDKICRRCGAVFSRAEWIALDPHGRGGHG